MTVSVRPSGSVCPGCKRVKEVKPAKEAASYGERVKEPSAKKTKGPSAERKGVKETKTVRH